MYDFSGGCHFVQSLPFIFDNKTQYSTVLNVEKEGREIERLEEKKKKKILFSNSPASVFLTIVTKMKAVLLLQELLLPL